MKIIDLCAAFNVSRAGYYAWCDRPPSATELRRNHLKIAIKETYDKDDTQGAPKIKHQLLRQGITASEKHIGNQMRIMGLVSRYRSKYRRYGKTNPAVKKEYVTNHLKQDFSVTGPYQKWVTDITEKEIKGTTIYFLSFMDLFGRMPVAYNFFDHMPDSEEVLATIITALQLVDPELIKGLIVHQDQGSQYTAVHYYQALTKLGVKLSYSKSGYPYDNSCAESFFSIYKNEFANRYHFEDADDFIVSSIMWIENHYKENRLHSSLGYLTPSEFFYSYQ